MPDPRAQIRHHGRPGQPAATSGAVPTRARHGTHYRGLVEVVRDVVSGRAHPFALSDFAARAIRGGMPVDPQVLFAPAEALASEARFVCLCLAPLGALHGDARAWLSARLRRPPERIEGSIPWNLACGGELLQPER